MGRSTPTTAFDGTIFVCTDTTEIFLPKLRSSSSNYNLPSFFTDLLCGGYLISIAYWLFSLLQPLLSITGNKSVLDLYPSLRWVLKVSGYHSWSLLQPLLYITGNKSVLDLYPSLRWVLKVSGYHSWSLLQPLLYITGNKSVLDLYPGRVAQWVTCLATDACLTADPGVSVPYFRGDWSWNNFYGHSPPFRWFIQEGLLSVTSESMCTNYWLTACSSLPRKKCG